MQRIINEMRSMENNEQMEAVFHIVLAEWNSFSRERREPRVEYPFSTVAII